MADALIKAWHGVFDRGSKQAQERLKKVHGHKPEFQAFLKSRGIEGGERSAKQATTSLKKATDTKVAAQKIADMRFKKALQASSDRVREMGRRRREGGEGLGGSLETTKDVIAHIKQYGSIKAGRLGEAMDRTQLIGKVAKDIEKKKAATKIVDRLKTISYGRGAGLNPAKDMKLNPSSPLKTDMSALSNKRHSMNYEEVQIDEVSKAEAEKVLGGAVKEKPKMPPGKHPAGYRYVRGLARRAMKGGVSAIHKSMEKTMAKEEVEQVVEQDDSMEKKEMAQTQLHFIKYAAEEILAFIDMGGEVEEWYQNKLSKVQSEVESLHSYIEGEKRRTGMVKEEEGQINEVKGDPGKALAKSIASRVNKHTGNDSKSQDAVKVTSHEDEHFVHQRYDDDGSQFHTSIRHNDGKFTVSHETPHSNGSKTFSSAEDAANHAHKLWTEEVEQVDEKAPPGAKYERMVKHIKKGYAKGGLTDKERSIAYATAWKAHNKANEEVEQIDELDRKTRVSYLKKSLTQLNNIASSRHTTGNKTYGSKTVGKRLAGLSRLERNSNHPASVRDNIDKARAQFEEVEQVEEKYENNPLHSMPRPNKAVGLKPSQLAKKPVTAEAAEGSTPTTPKEKALAAHHGDPKKITYGDVIKARLKSAAAKKMGK